MTTRKRLLVAVCAALVARSSCAFAPVMVTGIAWLTEYVGLPVSYALSCALVTSPPVRIFGTEQNVYGLDWGSLACHAQNVYGMQMCFCGGAVERRLCGLQLGILGTGYAMEELPFGDYHFCNLERCRMYGIQFGTFAAKTATANGAQLSAVYAEAQTANGLQLGAVHARAATVNGLQAGLVNSAGTLRGFQVGAYNSADDGCGLQLGLLNCTASGLAGCLPILNVVF